MQIWIAGDLVNIKESDEGFPPRKKLDGYYCPDDKEIVIHPKIPPSRITETFFHEAMEKVKIDRLNGNILSHDTLTILAEEVANICIQLGFYPQQAWHGK